MSEASRSIADQGVLEAAIDALLHLTEERRGDTFAAIRRRLIPALEEMRDRPTESGQAGQSTALANMQNAARYLVTEVVPHPAAFATGTVVLRRIVRVGEPPTQDPTKIELSGPISSTTFTGKRIECEVIIRRVSG